MRRRRLSRIFLISILGVPLPAEPDIDLLKRAWARRSTGCKQKPTVRPTSSGNVSRVELEC